MDRRQGPGYRRSRREPAITEALAPQLLGVASGDVACVEQALAEVLGSDPQTLPVDGDGPDSTSADPFGALEGAHVRSADEAQGRDADDPFLGDRRSDDRIRIEAFVSPRGGVEVVDAAAHPVDL